MCRATLSAETNGVIECLEAAIYFREVLFEVLNGQATLSEIKSKAKLYPIYLTTDADSLRSHLSTDTGAPADKRLRVLVAQIRQCLQEENVHLSWADTQVMLADSLTKLEAEREYLLRAIATGVWTPASTPESLKAKIRIREQRKERRDRVKAQVP